MERKRVQIFFNDESLTRQEFKDECDLDLMLKRFKRTPEGRAALANASGFAEGAQFLDVSSIPDFQSARAQLAQANASFMALPAKLRRRFENDSAQFLDFVLNPANAEEVRELGLCKPKEQSPISPMESKGT